MITVRLDQEFEKNKSGLIQDGIRALSLKLKREDITEENLGLFLYTKDPEVISKDASGPWREFLSEVAEEWDIINILKVSRAMTTKWLTSEGYKILNKRWPDLEVVNYLGNWQLFWATLITELEGEKNEEYYKPSLLQWALYLTIREPIPKNFPKRGKFTYAIKRWADIRNLILRDIDLIPKGWDNPEAQEIAKKSLEKRLKELYTAAETYIAKQEGTYSGLVEERRKRNKKPDLTNFFKLHSEAASKGQEVTLISP